MKSKIFKMIGALVVGLIGYALLSIINESVREITSNSTNSAPSVVVLAQLFPIVFVVIIIVSVVASFGKPTQEELQFNWLLYGERLKLAYAAKFGGRNDGFDNEVDYRINILKDTDKGFAREVARDWAKRMAKFTGIEWLRLEDSNEDE